MSFNSVQFLIFFPLVFLVLIILPKKIRKYWLLATSYYFYMCWSVKYSLILIFVTLLTYLSGLFIHRSQNPKIRKTICTGCIILNISLLFVFKYFNFCVKNINQLTGFTINALTLLLPLGISFFIFQGLGYVIDVYRQKYDARTNFIEYALFISFFPTLLSGPIERGNHILPQIEGLESKSLLDGTQILNGLILMGWGLVQKIVISDRLSLVVDTIFDNYKEYGFLPIVFATVMFAIQLYCDFDGYSNIARGAAQIIGIDLVVNFRQPYLATSVIDFWKRWHISLTSWFRDYLYIPLGGNRRGLIRKYLNILIVFLISGLWHGAEWSFVFWGLLHGTMQIASLLKERISSKFQNSKTHLTFSARLAKTFGTFCLVDIAWFFFRAPNINTAFNIIKHSVTRTGDFSMITSQLDISNWRILFIGLFILLIIDILHEKGVSIRELLLSQQIWFRYLIYLLLLVSCVYLGVNTVGGNAHSFIYFQF